MDPLPIDGFVPDILRHARTARAVVVTAAPGAGKTTRVPPALVEDGPVILLQPRRVAARAVARRIASERGWTLGREVGWHVRHERVFSAATSLVVATEGILTARLQQDPLLSPFRTVVIDEFHERSIHGDLGLALAKQAWVARDDLRIVVMSATLDAARVAAFLGGCPVVEVPGREYPLEISYRPGVTVEDAVIDLVRGAGAGSVLCFLPGAGEIRRAAERLAGARTISGITVLPLHGSLDGDEQDAALRPSDLRRVILATNIAETTLTVPDVTTVVDGGLHKVARHDPGRGIDSLDTERIALDSADQRAGRAGRLGPGRAVRLWDSRDRLRPHREPEIARVDVASTVLDVLVWGGDPRSFEWYEAPRAEALAAGLELLRRLGAIDERDALTPLGRDLGRVPLHPRLARLVLAARGAPVAARACALLSERHFVAPRHAATTCDLLSTVEDERSLPPGVLAAARHIRDAARTVLGDLVVDRIDETRFRQAVLAAYPDRVAQRRANDRERFLLASGVGARLARESGVRDADFIVAVDVGGATTANSAATEALVRLATRVEREWLRPTASEIRYELDPTSGSVRATRVDRLGAIALSEQPALADHAHVSPMLAAEYLRRGPSEADEQLLRRLAFAGHVVEFGQLVRMAAEAARHLDEIRLADHVPADLARRLHTEAPTSLRLPSGRDVRLDYRANGSVVAAVKIQQVFGLKASPRLGPRSVPVTFELLAPNGRPAQITSDLASFWQRGYPEVRKELRARYPKHKWPEEP
jgi:ATP-dependent helicase HrpB